MAIWQWDDRLKRYRNTRTGRFISRAQMIKLRDQFTESVKSEMRQLAEDLADGRLSLQRWVHTARDRLKAVFIDQYALGRGGRNSLTQSDYGRIGAMLKRQYQFLNGFAEDIAEGKLSKAQIGARLEMYADAGTEAYEKARGASFRVYARLPAYPGDGQTRCRSRCKCHWDYEEFEDRVEATWTLGVAEHCEDCVANAAKWNPYVVTK